MDWNLRRPKYFTAPSLLFAPIALALSSNLFAAGAGSANAKLGEDHALKLLGKHIFFDKSLSSSGEMGCVSCHEPFAGGTNGDSETNLLQVAVTSANGLEVGGRKPPTNTYASFFIPLQPCNRGGAALRGTGAQNYCGGNFYDGRAMGRAVTEEESLLDLIMGATEHIGEEIFYNIKKQRAQKYKKYISAISDQAFNPIPNTAEQDMSPYLVCQTVANSAYAWIYKKAWGVDLNCNTDIATGDETFVDISFKRLMFAVGAYQHSPDINSFSSKRDLALRAELACIDSTYKDYKDSAVCKMVKAVQKTNPDKQYGKFPLVLFTEQENLGHDLFYNWKFPAFGPPGSPAPQGVLARDDLPAMQCAFCHSDNPDSDDGSELEQIYVDQGFHNIGVPMNPDIPKPNNLLDVGLSAVTSSQTHGDGFFRVLTVRNVAKGVTGDFTKAFSHNGYFKSLKSLVHFYVTRDTLPKCEDLMAAGDIAEGTPLTEEVALANNCWPTPEFPRGATPPFIAGGLGTPDMPVTEAHEEALVAYMETLSDSHNAKPPVLLQFGVVNPLAGELGSGDLGTLVCDEGTTSDDCISLDEAMSLLGEDWSSLE
ncbi:cytochrome-c peroxidase [Microbulbifer pacificus]|uniref:Cytochrome c peroxidase n=1 Tax=Microbulbifer pacificus TaxID=407164 RepID=A0AAU0MZ92_9GAMM|nr:cytochrome c peroxidase [Microbulbifer pacificus]WOX05535.1 cytochrome c peroxidase [Microbulbifer pacificus]